MAKTIYKPIFTEDLDKYRRFLEASNVNLEASVETMQNEITAKKKICNLIKTYQETKTLPPDAIESLIQTTCPDFITLSAFEKLNDNIFTSVETALAETEAGEPVYDCSTITCETCWKNYINHMARLLNQSFIDVKMYDKGDNPDAD